MSNLSRFELLVTATTPSLLTNDNTYPCSIHFTYSECSSSTTQLKNRKANHSFKLKALSFSRKRCKKVYAMANAAVEEEQTEIEVAEGYTLTQFCDKMIDIFLNEKLRAKEWRKYLVFREEWNKYRENFYTRCQTRAGQENDPAMKEKLVSLASKVKKIDVEMERHSEVLKEVQESPTDVNAVVARRRKNFTGEFFRYLTLVSESYDNLEDRDAVARLATRCLSAVSAYDNTLESVDTLDVAQAKFDDILFLNHEKWWKGRKGTVECSRESGAIG